MYCKVVFDIALDREFDYILPPGMEARFGVRVRAPFGPRMALGAVVGVAADAPQNKFKLKQIDSVLDSSPAFGPDLEDLLTFLRANYGGTLGQLCFSLLAPFNLPGSAFNPAYGDVAVKEDKVLREFSALPFPKLLCGSDDKLQTLLALNTAVQNVKNGAVLLTAPDISSAERLAREAEKLTGGTVLLWHSKISLKNKKEVLSAVMSGARCIVAGTRSSALLPFKRLACAVMFDEQDADYKQEENKPFFHAREVLLHRTRYFNAPMLFVTATPSMELYKKVKDGAVSFYKTPPPAGFTRVLLTPKKGQNSALISDEAEAEITNALAAKENVLFLLNRRAAAGPYACLNCSLTAACPDCGGELFATEGASLYCKKCKTLHPPPAKCPKCGNSIFKAQATPASRAAREIKKLFKVPLTELNSSNLQAQDFAGKTGEMVLSTFSGWGALEDKIKFSAVCVLDADMELNSPDFRASERMLQTLFKAKHMAGEAKDGRLIIQAAKASAVFEAVVHEDYAAYADAELEFREGFGFPPYVSLVRSVVQSKSAEESAAYARGLAAGLSAKFADLSASVTPAGRKKDRLKKSAVTIKTKTPAAVMQALREVNLPKNIKLKNIADPYGFI